ncbi:type I-E CRISPR-associated protein Cse1/CasA [Streptacidiphilus cavernicola]|uniref:Type I-E CRISPR-associated protein Cse1/CasA n=1 Tax=Streptacidiphilus cavernicola TaxID=3342716 RepID=A0ABV6W4U1_9ACTN
MTIDQTARPSDETRSFDLTEQPWLPVLLADGAEALLSLREVFARAEEIRRLAGDVPTQDFALVRLLLAIAHDALDGPSDLDAWADLWAAGGTAFASVPEYLDRHRAGFDLLHPRTPFFQTAGLRTSNDEVFSLNRIIADVPNGDPFFTTRFPGADRITFAEAARWVVHAHAYDTSGIKTGVVGDPRAKNGKAYPQGVAWAGNLGGVLAEGRTLRETLLLNLIAADSRTGAAGPAAGVAAGASGAGDRPAWRRPPCGPGAAADDDLVSRPGGVRDLYTWQSRRLRLVSDDTGVYGVVLSYGDPLAQQDKQHVEPMTGWRRSQAQEKKLSRPLVYMPREHDPARAAWRGLAALIAPRGQDAGAGGDPPKTLCPGVVEWLARLSTEGVLPRGMLIRVRTYGAVYGTQQSVIDEITEDAVAMAVVLLGESGRALGWAAVDAVADAESAVTVLGDLATDLERASGGESESGRNTARDAGFGVLDGLFRIWLGAIREGDDPQQLRTAWQCIVRREVSRLGSELVARAGDAAWEGRVLTDAKGSVWLNTASADLWFRSRLKKKLPRAYDSDPAAVPGPGPGVDADSAPDLPKVPA